MNEHFLIKVTEQAQLKHTEKAAASWFRSTIYQCSSFLISQNFVFLQKSNTAQLLFLVLKSSHLANFSFDVYIVTAAILWVRDPCNETNF